jgi:hypothetical protein
MGMDLDTGSILNKVNKALREAAKPDVGEEKLVLPTAGVAKKYAITHEQFLGNLDKMNAVLKNSKADENIKDTTQFKDIENSISKNITAVNKHFVKSGYKDIMAAPLLKGMIGSYSSAIADSENSENK